MAIRAILFDLDGTLVDSERFSIVALARTLERDLGIAITEAEQAFVVGRSWRAIYGNLRAAHPGLVWSESEMVERVVAMREEILAKRGLPVIPGAVEAIDRFGHLSLGLVTGSSRVEACHYLELLGRADWFGVVVASEDVARSKPAPDGYLAAARALGVPVDECLVVEDSGPGIQAGLDAGARVVAVRAGNFSGHDQSHAHRVLDTLADLTIELVNDLVQDQHRP